MEILSYQAFSVEATEVLFLSLVKLSPFFKFSWASSLACLLILLFLLYLLSCDVKLPNFWEAEQNNPMFSADLHLCAGWAGSWSVMDHFSCCLLALPVLRYTELQLSVQLLLMLLPPWSPNITSRTFK